jgi:hypothetical protein
MMQWVFRMSAALERIDMSGDHNQYQKPDKCQRCGEVNPAYIHTCTPQREWVGLTDEEKEHYRKLGLVGVEIIETILKEKNYDKS